MMNPQMATAPLVRRADVWLVTSAEDLNHFMINNGWVVLISESPDPFLAENPVCLGASVLLPPYEAISAEIDENLALADAIYMDYLNSPACDEYLSAIIAAAMTNIPIGIYFGPEEKDMRFVQTFINFLFGRFGLVLGVRGRIEPSIHMSYMPFVLAKLYSKNIIDYKTFMVEHPRTNIDPNILPKLIADVRPYVKTKDIDSYYKYFMDMLYSIKDNNNGFLIDPLVGD